MRLRIAPRPIVYGLASVLAGGALSVAGAAIIFNGPIGGNANNAATPAIFYAASGNTATADSSGVTCATTTSTAATSPAAPVGFQNSLLLLIGNAYPSSVCTFKVNVIASGGGTDMQDIQLNVSTGGSTPTSIPYTAALGSSCGATLSNSASTPTAVTFTVTAPPLSTWVATQGGPITGNLQAVPAAQYSSTACT